MSISKLIEELKRNAERASPDWFVQLIKSESSFQSDQLFHSGVIEMPLKVGRVSEQGVNNWNFISSASPQNILRLIQVVEELESELSQVRERIKVLTEALKTAERYGSFPAGVRVTLSDALKERE